MYLLQKCYTLLETIIVNAVLVAAVLAWDMKGEIICFG